MFAGIIAFGVVYNAARVSLSERSRELASLRVLGFTRAEISLILLGELALLTLAALPVGALLGYGMAAAIVESFDSEVYRFPLVVSRAGDGVGVSDDHRRRAGLGADRPPPAGLGSISWPCSRFGSRSPMRRVLTNWLVLGAVRWSCC